MKTLGELWQRIRRWLLLRETAPVDYIHGADTLPPPLPAQTEAELLTRMKQGDRQARDSLIEHNLRLVVYIAKRFENSGVGIEDLISIGTIGLIKAINTFCPGRNIKLATYSSRCIENEILMVLRKNAPLRNEMSIDEPLNVDWDGNELLLSDILGSDPDEVNRDLEQEAAMRRAAGAAGAADYGAALRHRRQAGAYAEGGGGSDGHLPVLHIPPGKAHYPAVKA